MEVRIPQGVKRKILGSSKFKRQRSDYRIVPQVFRSSFYDMFIRACLRSRGVKSLHKKVGF
jgi:hypothetical protein